MSNLLPPPPAALQSLLDSSLFQHAKALFESTLFRSADPTPSRTAVAFDLLFGARVPYYLALFSQLCRITAVMIVLPIFLIGVLDFAGYAVFRTLGLHKQRVRVKRSTATTSADAPPRFVKRTPRVYHSDRGRPTDNSNMPSIVKAPLLSPGTYDAEMLLRHRQCSLSAASEDVERVYIDSGGYFARVGAKQNETDEDGEAVAVGSSTASQPGSETEIEGEGQQPSSMRVPGIGVEGPLGIIDTDGESGTESGRESPVMRFTPLSQSLRGGNGGASGRRRGLSGGGLQFTPVTEFYGGSPQPISANRSIDSAVSETVSSSADCESLGGSLGGSWVVPGGGADEGELDRQGLVAAIAADLEPQTSSF